MGSHAQRRIRGARRGADANALIQIRSALALDTLTIRLTYTEDVDAGDFIASDFIANPFAIDCDSVAQVTGNVLDLTMHEDISEQATVQFTGLAPTNVLSPQEVALIPA